MRLDSVVYIFLSSIAFSPISPVNGKWLFTGKKWLRIINWGNILWTSSLSFFKYSPIKLGWSVLSDLVEYVWYKLFSNHFIQWDWALPGRRRVQNAAVFATGTQNITAVLFFRVTVNHLHFAKLKGRSDTDIEQFSWLLNPTLKLRVWKLVTAVLFVS